MEEVNAKKYFDAAKVGEFAKEIVLRAKEKNLNYLELSEACKSVQAVCIMSMGKDINPVSSDEE